MFTVTVFNFALCAFRGNSVGVRENRHDNSVLFYKMNEHLRDEMIIPDIDLNIMTFLIHFWQLFR